jgi:DNA-binding transcriptional LysR family regulator
MEIRDLVAFVAIADAGSISAAARELELSKSVVSERLAALESSLRAQLVQRTTRKLALTGDGDAFLARARTILAEVDEARAELALHHAKIAGPLRLSAPVSFGTLHLSRALFPFLEANPDIRLTLDLDDRFVDVVGDGYDAVIRHSRIADARVIVKRLGSSRRHFVASPAYLARRGAPRNADDLLRHVGIIYTHRDADWRVRTANRVVVIRPDECIRLNNGILMRDAAVAGLGIALLPRFLVHQELASGALSVVDVAAAAEGAEVFVAYPSARASAKVRALVDWLRRAFGTPPYWEVGGPAPGK